MSSTLKVEEVKKMKVTDLKRELKLRNLSTVGSKDKLVARLEEEIETENVAFGDDNTEEIANVEDLGEVEDILAGSTSNSNDLKIAKAEKLAVEIKVSTDGPARNTDFEIGIKPVSEVDRKVARAARFNISCPESDTSKKDARAKRFGISEAQSRAIAGSSINPSNPLDSIDRMKRRAERFGESVSPVMQKIDQVDKLLKRKEKFSLSGSSFDSNLESRKKMRLERFGMAT